jgi:hypothetical protein
MALARRATTSMMLYTRKSFAAEKLFSMKHPRLDLRRRMQSKYV